MFAYIRLDLNTPLYFKPRQTTANKFSVCCIFDFKKSLVNLRQKKRLFCKSFLKGDDRKEIYLIIRLRIFLEISFESKSDYSLLHALQTTLFLR